MSEARDPQGSPVPPGSDPIPPDQDPIPFDRSMDARANEIVAVSGLIRRVICANGGPFTFTGTCSYVVGTDRCIVIDPGPIDGAHEVALLDALGGRPVDAVLVTHQHRDHSPGAVPLARRLGIPILGPAPIAGPTVGGTDLPALDASQDPLYRPDRVLREGDVVSGPGFMLEAIETPGHTSNHLSYALAAERALFSGDHVMAWSTTVVAPPDGSMRSYMLSLAKLQARTETVYWPGHGGPVREPARFLRALAGHRRQREQAILAQVRAGIGTAPAIVKLVYSGLAPALRGAAALSVQAHLEDLEAKGLIVRRPGSGAGPIFEARDGGAR